MPNQWGTAQPMLAPTALGCVGAADVTCNAGSKTIVIASAALVAPSNGNYFPLIFGTLFILLGGTAPSALVVGVQLGSGSSADTMTVEPGLLVNSAELIVPIALVGAQSGTSFGGSGSVVNVTVTATSQAVTAKLDSRAIVLLCRGTD